MNELEHAAIAAYNETTYQKPLGKIMWLKAFKAGSDFQFKKFKSNIKKAFYAYYMVGFPHQVDFEQWFKINFPDFQE